MNEVLNLDGSFEEISVLELTCIDGGSTQSAYDAGYKTGQAVKMFLTVVAIGSLFL